MKIVRINKGRAINLPIRFASIILMVVILIKLMDVLPEPWSILTAMLITSFVPAIWFSFNVIIINEENKTLFDGVWAMGRKLGKPIKYSTIDKFLINKVKTKQTMYSLSNQQNVVANHEYRAYMKLDNGDQYFLFSHPLEETAKKKMTKMKKKLEIN